MALNLFGVTVNDAHMAEVSVPDTEMIAVRDLAAICGPADYREVDLGDATVTRLSEVVAGFAARGPVLPAPVGVVFRSTETVQRWLELHYSALSEALTFVENRVAARVHMARRGPDEQRTPGVDLDAVAAESLRVLRRAAVATLPLRADRSGGAVLSAAFLVEQELWKQFVGEVEAQAMLAADVRFDITGPWPPYDFVQMQLGA